ncbi:MAG: phospholipase D-like domain-containing protein [Candidatus Asgardarchaeum sp.]
MNVKRNILLFMLISSVIVSYPVLTVINRSTTIYLVEDRTYNIETIAEFPIERIEGNMSIIVFTSPDSSYDVLVNLINSAKNDIKIEIYSIYNPYLLKALNDAIKRGVSVNVITEKYHASSFENNRNIWAAWNLTQAGASVYWSNDTEFAYTHAKMAIIDSSLTVIMSGNWVKTGVPVHSSYGNREWGVVINNSDVADYFIDVFIEDLSIARPYSTSDGNGTSVSGYIPHGQYPHPFTSDTFQGYFEVTPVVSPDTSETLIRQLIDSANETLEIAQLYIYKNWGTSLSPFVTDIVEAAQRGVKVRILLNNGSSPNEDLVQHLQSYENIAVAYSNDTYFENYHVKGVIVDGKIVLVSSINWSKTSVRSNRETGVIIKGKDVAMYFRNIFNWDWSVSKVVFNNIVNATEETHSQPSGEEGAGWLSIIIETGIAGIIIAIIVFILKSRKK